MDVSPGELMVAQAAREIRDGERVFVGMRLPLIAFVLAKRTHAPNAVGLFELGIVRDQPSPVAMARRCFVRRVTSNARRRHSSWTSCNLPRVYSTLTGG